ncbi:MAG: hypothetical protein ACK4ON_11415 [Bacteroidia bacterium]
MKKMLINLHRKLNYSFILIFLFALNASVIQAQCYDEGSGTCSTSPTTISTAVTWNAEYRCINDDLVITSTGSLTITGISSVEIAAGKEIQVNR